MVLGTQCLCAFAEHSVEMGIARVRALKLHRSCNFVCRISSCRNGNSPSKGIETGFLLMKSDNFLPGRNGNSPSKGIETRNKIVIIYNINLCRNGNSPSKGIETVF